MHRSLQKKAAKRYFYGRRFQNDFELFRPICFDSKTVPKRFFDSKSIPKSFPLFAVETEPKKTPKQKQQYL